MSRIDAVAASVVHLSEIVHAQQKTIALAQSLIQRYFPHEYLDAERESSTE